MMLIKVYESDGAWTYSTSLGNFVFKQHETFPSKEEALDHAKKSLDELGLQYQALN
jgi:hypothetical protein